MGKDSMYRNDNDDLQTQVPITVTLADGRGRRNMPHHHRSHMATIPPRFSSGRASIFREPQMLHLMCMPTSGTGVSRGSRRVAGVHVALVSTLCAAHPRQFVVAYQISEDDGLRFRHSRGYQ